MINGIKIKNLTIHQDIPDLPEQKDKKIQRGFLIEILRNDDKLMEKFGQTIITKAYQGDIKAFHWHKKQDDLWFVATGQAKIVLYDLRENSSTHRQTQIIFAGENDYKLILIPQGVAHGYQVLSDEPVLLFYHVTETYNLADPDEQRIPYDDPTIGFDWDK